jgi:hypothetical protein
MAETLSIDDKIKYAELQLKQAELDLKKSELAERSRLTYTIMRNPVVIAATITLIATLCTAIFGFVTSHVQAQAEHRKFQEQLNANIILSVLKRNRY